MLVGGSAGPTRQFRIPQLVVFAIACATTTAGCRSAQPRLDDPAAQPLADEGATPPGVEDPTAQSRMHEPVAAGASDLDADVAAVTESTTTADRQQIPRVFDAEGLIDFELPLPNTDITVEHITPEYYYSLPERVIQKAYPVYHPDYEPPGYIEWLRTLEPGSAIDFDTIDSRIEWIRAGELVFDDPQGHSSFDISEHEGAFSLAAMVAEGTPVAADGTIPFARYVVVAKGDVRMGAQSCGGCHTRVLAGGAVVKGAQGNMPVNALLAGGIEKAIAANPDPPPALRQGFRALMREQFRAPWNDHPSQTMLDTNALAMYLYSLDPLPSPHAYDAGTLALGERVFVEEGCVTCHPPPLFTNNELTPVDGFTPPDDHYDRFPIFDVSVETDPGLALHTRRGTGYYKVPSLRGLWYRELLLHDGSVTLEQLFDPARLRDDFVPAGFRGLDSTRAVPGHPFGLELDERKRAALIAYLSTL